MNQVFLFGNSDIEMDSLPIRLVPNLEKQFPDTTFTILDPNEEWEIPDPFVVIDTVVGLTDIHVFRSLDEFERAPTVSMHDFDALFNLRYLAKLGKLKRVIIIGLPPEIKETEALEGVAVLLREIVLS